MKFKNIIVYNIDRAWAKSPRKAEDAFARLRYVPASPSQKESIGWVEPRGEANGPLVEIVGGQWLLEFLIETKAVPGSAVRRKLDERCAQIEASTGRKPGKKERRELKEDITHELLPMAFARFVRIAVWIDPGACRLVINTNSATRADEVVTSLTQALEGFAVSQVNTRSEPASAMATWLMHEPPAGLTIDRECELKATDDSKAVVRYAHHALDIEEVREHIEAGKRPTRLAMTWEGRVSFELTDTLRICKIVFLGGADDAKAGSKAADNFDADAAIATGELGHMLLALLGALNGGVAVS